MAFVATQNSILMNSQYTGRYRFFTGRNEENANHLCATPSYLVPFTVSILASQSLFLGELYSPAATLIIPFYRKDIPYGYIFIIFMQAVTALLVKWAYTPSPLYMPLLGTYQSLPDFESLRIISSLSQPQGTKLNPGTKRTNRTLSLNNGNGTNSDEVPSTPLIPEGIAINLSFLAPFSSPTSRASSLFSIKLTLIKNAPGYVITVVTLIIYFVLKPYFDNKKKSVKSE